jgi:hypothetical protein
MKTPLMPFEIIRGCETLFSRAAWFFALEGFIMFKHMFPDNMDQLVFNLE